jgi:hypothetical protein
MRVCVHAPRRVLLAPALALAPCTRIAQRCHRGRWAKTIQEVFKRPIEVKKVVPSALKGLCESRSASRARPNILYTDATGAHFVTGHLIDAANGKDLTEEALSVLNSLSPEDMKRLDALVAISLGTKGKPVYFVTDPQ